MTIVDVLKEIKESSNPVSIYAMAKELEIERSILYKYINGSRMPSGIAKFGLACYLYLSYGIETDELKPYKHLFDRK